MVNTKTANRRPLRFASLADLRADVQRLADADRAGTLQRAGNWTLGQALGHIAGWLDVAYDGYPPSLPTPPWPIVLVLKLLKNRFLNKGFPAGQRIPKVDAGTMFCDPLPLDQGLARLTDALDRLERIQPTVVNKIFGPLTQDETIKLTLRHAELHLSFFSAAR
jgi:hypothetical protein